MKAIVINKFGKPNEVFETIELPVPIISADEILVKVMATSVNPVDYKIRRGELPGLAGNFPSVLHGDVAGVVEEIGSNVSGFRKGDNVYGFAGGVAGLDGALSEYMKGDYRLFAKKPSNLSFTEAGAMPLVIITAYEAIFDRAQVKPGQKVLVYGGVGGVGHLGIQFAKIAGAEVFATVSSEKQALAAKKLGSDHIINYKTETVDSFVEKHTNGKGFDVVFDTIGNENLINSFNAAKLNGTVVTTSSLIDINLTPIHLKGLNFLVVFTLIPMLHNTGKERHGEILSKVATWVEQGKVRPLIDEQVFSFENIGLAHQRAESGPLIGKVVITKDKKMNSIAIAEIHSKPEAILNVKRALQHLVDETHQEHAFKVYDLLQNIDDPNHFTMYEIWEDEAGFQSHNQMSYIKKFVLQSKEWLAKPMTVVKYKPC